MDAIIPKCWRILCAVFLVVVLAVGCSESGGDSTQDASSEQSTQFSVNMSALKKQETSSSLFSAMLNTLSFTPSDVYTGELMVTNTSTLESEIHFWSVYVDDETFAVQSNKTIVLSPGDYEISMLVERGDQQYAGTALATISGGTNNVNLTLRPIIGDTVVNVNVVASLADFKFSYNPSELSGMIAPQIGIIVDSGMEEIFTINPATGISDSYVNLSAGAHNIQLKLCDAALQIGKSIEAQEDVIIVAGLDLQLDLIPLYGEMTVDLSEEGGDANFSFMIPAEIIDEVGGLSNLEAIFKAVGPTNPLQEAELTVAADGTDYASSVTLTGIQFGSVTLSMEFYDSADSEMVANCNIATALNTTARTLACDIDLRRRAVIGGNLMAVVGVNVFSSAYEPIAGAVITEGGDVLGITGSGSFGTAGYLKLYMISGSHGLRAESATHYGETSFIVDPLDITNEDIFLEYELGISETLTLIGDVIDAPVAFGDVTLVDYASVDGSGDSTPLYSFGPVQTDASGTYSLTADLASVPADTVLALKVEGQQKVAGGLVPDCSTMPQDTYVDIDKDGVYDATGDACLGEKLSLISILGKKDNVLSVSLSSSGIIDTANMPELLVTHVTTAEALLLATYITDPSDDAEVNADLSGIATALEFEEQMQQQVAAIGALYRALNHETPLPPGLTVELAVRGGDVDSLIAAIINGDYILTFDDRNFLQGIIDSDDSNALSDLMTVATDLTGVDFSISSPYMATVDPISFETLNDAYVAIVDNFTADLLSDPTADISLFTDNHCTSHFMHNGMDGDQYAQFWVDLVNVGMPDSGEFLDSAFHTGAHIVRLADETGLLYFNATTNEIDSDPAGYPIYVKKGAMTAGFPSIRYHISIDDPRFNLDGYVIENTPGSLCEIGNLVKFNIQFRASNEQGRREIEMYIEDEDRGSGTELYYIDSVQIDVSDDGLAALPDEIPYEGGGVFKTNCTPLEAENQATSQRDTLIDYQCLNTFVLYYNDLYHEPYWGPVHAPDSEGHLEHSFIIPSVAPFDWIPDQDTVFTVTVNYSVGGVPAGSEIYEKSFRIFPTEEYLAKLLFYADVSDDGDASNLVDGSDSIGSSAGLNLFWRFREFDTSDAMVFPADARINISLWDPILEEDVPGFDRQLDANQRSVELTGDLSSYTHLELSIELELADGSEADAEYHLVYDAVLDDWTAYPFSRVGLKEQYYTVNDKTTPSLTFGKRNSMDLASAYGQIASSISLDLWPGFTSTQTDPYTFDFHDYQRWEAQDALGNWLTFEGTGRTPELSFTYTPTYLTAGTPNTITYKKLYDASSDHQVRDMYVGYDGFDITVSWTAPLDTSTFVSGENVYHAWYSINGVHVGSRSFQSTDTSFDISMPVYNPADEVEIEVTANHFDWMVEGSYKLICRMSDISADTCEE